MPQLERFELTRAYIAQAFNPLFEPQILLKRVPFCVKPDEVERIVRYGSSKWANVKHVVLSGTPLKWPLRRIRYAANYTEDERCMTSYDGEFHNSDEII